MPWAGQVPAHAVDSVRFPLGLKGSFHFMNAHGAGSLRNPLQLLELVAYVCEFDRCPLFYLTHEPVFIA